MLKLKNLLLLFALAGLLQGCTYFQKRGADAREIIDLGLSFSSKPQFALYYSGPFVQVLAIGYGNVDGTFTGLGDGEFRMESPHYERSIGLLPWGDEIVSFEHGKAEVEAMSETESVEEANHMQVGVAGMAMGLAGVGAPPPGKEYIGSCPHYLHLGWVGLVFTPRFLQTFDFVLGWTTLDILGDDDE